MERAALDDLAATLGTLPDGASAEDHPERGVRGRQAPPLPRTASWFGCLYQVLLGQQEGPRFGGFVALYGVPETIALIHSALARQADAA